MHWTQALSAFYGLQWIAPDLDPWTTVRTLLLINTCNAVMCRVFARNDGRKQNGWTAVGFALGIWAVALLMILPKPRKPAG